MKINKNLFQESGKFLYHLGRADLAYIAATISFPVTMTIDMIDYTFVSKKEPLRRSIRLLENCLRFSEGGLK